MNSKSKKGTQRFKQSYGIACCRYNLVTKRPEVLMVKKRYTYAFFNFVFTKYKKNDDVRLHKLFDQMSIQEKADILQLDFDKLWIRIRIKIPSPPEANRVINNKRTNRYTRGLPKHNLSITQLRTFEKIVSFHQKLIITDEYNNLQYYDANHYKANTNKDKIDNEWRTYYIKRDKFNRNFILSDRGKRLKKLINGTKSVDSIWEIPKGRPNKNEKPINTAIREFKEETDLSIDKYTFLTHIKPIVNSYIVNRCRYTHTYFIAVAKDFKLDPKINFQSYEQMTEVENIQWVSLQAAEHLNLKHISPYLRILKLVKRIFKIFRDNYKKSHIIEN